MDLHEILKTSYANKDKQKKALSKHGYKFDSILSNHNQQIYYNPNDKKILNLVAGTHNLSDVGTDAYLAVGKLKDTNRYKEADRILKEAKKKYQPSKTIVAGQSLGGAIAGYISSGNDEVYTLNKGATIGQKVRANEHAYRTSGDLISLANANSKHMKTLENENGGIVDNIKKSVAVGGATHPFVGVAYGIRNALNAHSTESIRNSGIKI